LDTQTGNVNFEWLPVYYPLHFHEPFQPLGLPVIARFDPALLVQYDYATGRKQFVAFNNRQDALRVGPQAALNLFPLPGAPEFLSHFSSLITYDFDYETYSGKPLHWFTSSLVYNIDTAGHIGLKASYQRGREETSGVSTNVYMLSLSGKI
jgi:hypothetical protein